MKTENPIFSIRPMEGRKAPPSHYSFKIESFSLLSESSVEKVVSEEFEAGGHKWSLSIYPTGNLKEDGQDHVSIYLVLMNTCCSPLDWEVNAIVNFSVYNFLNDEYVATQDTTVRRFHVLKTGRGISKFIGLDTFKDPSNGYLIDDTCVFGVEVFVVKTMNKGDCLSMIHGSVTHSYSWKFNNFSIVNLEEYESVSFVGGDYKWKLNLYPNGHMEGKACQKFSNSSSAWGSRQLVALAKFKDPNNGFLVDDTCILEAEFKVLGLITPGIN
ncbi:ubiquitin C-terminal hydrolase 12-like [Gastrolobium bilobum]|uniref:ubiquitin C-terminal hydrolase 12-like n=1 Tax=Gastrolobium bilobum TaxID=150636 RepID=UPI002AB2C854|nr:ubiquitin C-terminal hydrolase 12-like [Gastrolobium bilobum]